MFVITSRCDGHHVAKEVDSELSENETSNRTKRGRPGCRDGLLLTSLTR
jgi:hypothetical protein